MGILDDALNSQDAKRSQRLNREAQKSKIENNKIKEGTYCGVDLVDGTAIVQLDGQDSTTSGYRLITNAPLGDGDRVSIRPNGMGLPRADAKNVAPKIATEVIKKDELIFASLGYVGIATPRNTQDFFLDTRTSYLNKGGLMQYKYDPKSLVFKSKGKFDLTKNTRIPPSPIGTNFEVDFTGDNNFVTYSYPVGTGSLFAEFAVYFPAKIWKKIFEPWLGVYYPNTAITFNQAPVEVEMILGGLMNNFSSLTIRKDTGIDYYYIAGDCQYPTLISPITFSFRFRKRVTSGDPLPWFHLK